MIRIPGTMTDLPAVLIDKRPTSAANAWLGGDYLTAQVISPFQAIRVHVNAGEGAATQEHLATGAGLVGRWFAVGDYVQTYDEYRLTHALPGGHFTHIAICVFSSGTVFNVGRCSPIFNAVGGAEQVEYVSGPVPQLRPIDATWSRLAGHA